MTVGNKTVEFSIFFYSIHHFTHKHYSHSSFLFHFTHKHYSQIVEKMSGDGNSSGGGSSRRRSGGFDLNSFDDWASMYNCLGTLGSSPGTQASTTPPAYQTPHFDVDAYYRPSPPEVRAIAGIIPNSGEFFGA